MISLKNISKEYIDKATRTLALNNINIEIKESLLTAILGKSGSGKTTLKNIIGGIDLPTNGDVFINDTNLAKLSDKELAIFRRKNIGFIFQAFYLEKSFTVYENLLIPFLIDDINKNDANNRIDDLLQKLDIFNLKNKKVCDLSGGEKQRVAIARALALNPDVILADEPTGNLDSENGKIVLDILKDLASNGKTIVLVTHNEDDARKYADEIIRLKDGSIENEVI